MIQIDYFDILYYAVTKVEIKESNENFLLMEQKHKTREKGR